MTPLSLLLAASLAASQPCQIETRKSATLEPAADLYEFNAMRGVDNARFRIDRRSGAWVGGLNSCGEGGARDGERTLFSVETVGRFTIYSIHCGGTMQAREARAQVVFADDDPRPVYVRSRLMIARWGLPNGAHSGPLKELYHDFTCVQPGFNPARLPPLPRFESSPRPERARPSLELGELLRQARP